MPEPITAAALMILGAKAAALGGGAYGGAYMGQKAKGNNKDAAKKSAELVKDVTKVAGTCGILLGIDTKLEGLDNPSTKG